MNQDENRKRKLFQSPVRDPFPLEHEKKFRPRQSPHELLRMMGQFAPTADRFEPIEEDTTHTPSTKPLGHYVPVSTHDRFKEIDLKLKQLPVSNIQDTSLNANAKLNLIRPKIRHNDYDSDDMNVSYFSNSDFSLLDIAPSKPMDDDTRSIATQDMLDDDPTVLDIQDIEALRRARDEQAGREQPFYHLSQQSVPDFQSLPKPMSAQPEPSASVHVDGLSSVRGNGHADTVVSTRPDPPLSVYASSDHQSAESIHPNRDIESVHSGFDPESPRSVDLNGDTSPVHQDNTEFDPMDDDGNDDTQPMMEDDLSDHPSEQEERTNTHALKEKGKGRATPLAVPSDLRESHDLMNDTHLADTDWGDDDYGQSWSDNELDDTNYQPHTRIIPGTCGPPVKDGEGFELYSVINNSKLRELFSRRLDFGTKVSASGTNLNKIKKMYFDQLVNDIKAFKEHRSEDDATVTKEDVLLLMKRQRLLDDKTTIESLAHKYLSREYSDLLCTSALTDNQTYPY